ncbi:hypothetical protein KO465_04355 [Candidatus Micrarchaeota archaeon]|jgi:hypothetical protein|nr:hypothetical protein [Candidatus Micrarchaeota archaeon]
MNQKAILLAGGAIALLGIAYMASSGGGSQETSGTGGGGAGGGGVYMPGQGIAMAPAAVGGTGVPNIGYTIALPEIPAAPTMMAMPDPQLPSLPESYGTWGGGGGGDRSSTTLTGVSVSTPGGGSTYAYGTSGLSEAKAAQSAAISVGAPNVNVGREIAPGVTMVADSPSTKKDSAATEAAKAGLGAGAVSSAIGSTVSKIGSAIGGLFGW